MNNQAARWAEYVANAGYGNSRKAFEEVPEEFKEEVKQLLDKLVNGPLPKIVHRNFRYKSDEK